MVPPRFELGSREPESHMLPLHHGTYIYQYILCFFSLFLSFFFYKKTPPVGLEPTTLRLKAARSTDWARKAPIILFAFVLFIYNSLLLFSLFTVSFFLLLLLCYLLLFFFDVRFYLPFSLWFFEMTTWPSGLRRVTRNHFSSGGVGSNPAVVVFYPFYSDYYPTYIHAISSFYH